MSHSGSANQLPRSVKLQATRKDNQWKHGRFDFGLDRIHSVLDPLMCHHDIPSRLKAEIFCGSTLLDPQERADPQTLSLLCNLWQRQQAFARSTTFLSVELCIPQLPQTLPKSALAETDVCMMLQARICFSANPRQNTFSKLARSKKTNHSQTSQTVGFLLGVSICSWLTLHQKSS